MARCERGRALGAEDRWGPVLWLACMVLVPVAVPALFVAAPFGVSDHDAISPPRVRRLADQGQQVCEAPVILTAAGMLPLTRHSRTPSRLRPRPTSLVRARKLPGVRSMHRLPPARPPLPWPRSFLPQGCHGSGCCSDLLCMFSRSTMPLAPLHARWHVLLGRRRCSSRQGTRALCLLSGRWCEKARVR